MFTINITGLKEAQAAVDDAVKNKIPILTAMALTDTAKGLKTEIEKKLPQIFDRPTPWTLNSVMMMSANYRDVNPSAYVWFKDEVAKGTPAAKYLLAEIFGGARKLKRYEKALQRFGVLPYGYYTVPGQGVKLDDYGNIPSGTITEMLTGVGTLVGMSDTTFNGKLGGYTKRKNTTANYFVVKQKHGGLVPGIWFRMPEASSQIKKRKGILTPTGPKAVQKGVGSGIFYSVIQGRRVRPVLIFVRQAPQYRVRLPFFEWAQAYVDVELPKAFNRLVAERLAHIKAKV